MGAGGLAPAVVVVCLVGAGGCPGLVVVCPGLVVVWVARVVAVVRVGWGAPRVVVGTGGATGLRVVVGTGGVGLAVGPASKSQYPPFWKNWPSGQLPGIDWPALHHKKRFLAVGSGRKVCESKD